MKIPGVEFTVSREFHDARVAELEAQLTDWIDAHSQLKIDKSELQAQLRQLDAKNACYCGHTWLEHKNEHCVQCDSVDDGPCGCKGYEDRRQAQLRQEREALWRARQFIVENVQSGAEFGAVLDIDKSLEQVGTNQQHTTAVDDARKLILTPDEARVADDGAHVVDDARKDDARKTHAFVIQRGSGLCVSCGHTHAAPIHLIPDPLTARIAELEAQLRQANQRFDDHTEHVSRFLSDMYAVMIDPLDSSGLNVAEMTATLLDAAKRDRETANMHADALGTLQAQLRQEREASQAAGGDLLVAASDLMKARRECAHLREEVLRVRKTEGNSEGEVLQAKDPGPSTSAKGTGEAGASRNQNEDASQQLVAEFEAQLRQEREAHCIDNQNWHRQWQISDNRVSELREQVSQLRDNAIPDLEEEVGMQKAQVAQLQITQEELTRQRDMHACNAVEMMRQRDELAKENRDLLGLDREINDEVAQLQTTISQLHEALEIACRSGKFANPRAASERIVAAVAARAALATCPAPEEK